MIYVVAPDYEQFSKWLRNQLIDGDIASTTEVKYIRDHQMLMGARLETAEDDIIFLPGWDLLEDAADIRRYAEVMRARFPDGGLSDEEARAELERVRERILLTGDPFVDCD